MTGTRRRLVVVAMAYAATAGAASVVATREELPGRPLGLGLPIPVWAQVASAWGAGIAPPWPMPLLAVIAADRACRTGSSGWALTVGLVGVTNLVGHAIEPVTWRPRTWTPTTRVTAGVMMGSAAVLAVVGLRTADQLRDAERHRWMSVAAGLMSLDEPTERRIERDNEREVRNAPKQHFIASEPAAGDEPRSSFTRPW
jgi:hypothetical protein